MLHFSQTLSHSISHYYSMFYVLFNVQTAGFTRATAVRTRRKHPKHFTHTTTSAAQKYFYLSINIFK